MKKTKIIFYLTGIIILILIAKNLIFSILNLKGKSNILTSLRKNLEEKKRENIYLKEKLSYVKTADFIKEEARNKLGLVQKGEYLVITPPENSQTPNTEKIPTWKKWLNLFF